MWDGLIGMEVNFLCVEFVVRLPPPLFDNSTRLPGIFHPTKHVLADMEPQFRLTSGVESGCGHRTVWGKEDVCFTVQIKWCTLLGYSPFCVGGDLMLGIILILLEIAKLDWGLCRWNDSIFFGACFFWRDRKIFRKIFFEVEEVRK